MSKPIVFAGIMFDKYSKEFGIINRIGYIRSNDGLYMYQHEIDVSEDDIERNNEKINFVKTEWIRWQEGAEDLFERFSGSELDYEFID